MEVYFHKWSLQFVLLSLICAYISYSTPTCWFNEYRRKDILILPKNVKLLDVHTYKDISGGNKLLIMNLDKILNHNSIRRKLGKQCVDGFLGSIPCLGW